MPFVVVTSGSQGGGLQSSAAAALLNRIEQLEASMESLSNPPPLNPEAELFCNDAAAMGTEGLEAPFSSRILDNCQNRDAARQAKEARACCPADVSAQKCGWGIASRPRPSGAQPHARHIEVKGWVKGAPALSITRNEILHAQAQSEKARLALGVVAENDAIAGPHYVPHPFKEEPGWGVSSVNDKLKAFLKPSARS